MYRRAHIVFLCCLFLGIGILDLRAQEVTYTLYNETNGLNRSSINDIRRDSSGYFWLATEKGLVRFDGRNFIDVAPDIPHFRDAEITKLKLAENSLYIIYRDSGCIVMDLSDFHFRKISGESVSDIAIISREIQIILLRNGNMLKYQYGRITQKKKYYSEKEGLLQLHRGTLLASLPDNGLFVIDTTDLTPKRKLSVLPEGYFESFSVWKDQLYFITNGKLKLLDRDLESVDVQLPDASDADKTSYISRISDNLAFLIRNNKKLIAIRERDTNTIQLPELINFELKNIWVQDSSNLLIGSNQGLVHLRIGIDATSRLNDNIDNEMNFIRIRRKILEDEDRTLYLFGNPYTYTYKGKGLPEKLSDRKISMYDVVRVGEAYYVATEGMGLIRFKKGTNRIETVDFPPLHTKGQYVSVNYDRNRKVILVGGYDLLIEYNPEFQTARQIPLPAQTGLVRCILYDSIHSRIWLGTETGVICFNKQFTAMTGFDKKTGELSGRNIGSLILRKNREIWAGHENGVDLISLDSMKVTGSLPQSIFINPKVVSILEDDMGRMWMGTYSGIVGYDPATGNFNRLGKANRLLNIEFNYKSALKMSNGKLIFGGLNGYDIVDPGKINFNRQDETGIFTGMYRFIDTDTVFQHFTSDPGLLTFNTEDEYLRIYISSKNMLNAVNHTYEYNIDGGQWNSISGPSYINIFKLDPGIYTINVRAFDEFGSLISFPKLQIEAKVPFLKSRLFLLLLTLTAFIFLFLFVLVLMRSSLQEQKLKERISMDLHDEVGTILTRALYVARSDEQTAGNSRLINYLNESLFSLRAYINTMNYSTFSFRKLTDEIKEMVNALLNMTGVKHDVTEKTDGDYQIKGELFRDIRLCLYEIISNTLKHSRAGHISVYVTAHNHVLTIFTRDNGVLTDVAALGQKGNGMKNLRKRVSKHHGTIEFSTPKHGSGLGIKMRFPL